MASKMPSFTTDASAITGKMETTREGFLFCRDVPLARTGDQTYDAFEVPSLPAKFGKVIAQRDASEVFAAATIESFRGKPLTDDHPTEDVDPRNYKRYIIGTVMSPRRGTGADADCVVGDLIVYDATAIAKIRAGKRELSCGYDADYEVIAPGRARQIGIRGNHVSLVDAGRCGPTCAIRDRKTMQHRDCGSSCSCRNPPAAKDATAKMTATIEEIGRKAAASSDIFNRISDNLDTISRKVHHLADQRREALAYQRATDAGSGLVSATSGYVRDAAGNRVRPMTPADLNEIADKHYGRVR